MRHPEHPAFQDFGDVLLHGDGGSGYMRLDWFTPDGLATWGDGRLTVLGTDGYIEIRKYVDIGGRAGGNHLFIADQKGARYIDCSRGELPFGTQLVDDVLNRTETAMSGALFSYGRIGAHGASTGETRHVSAVDSERRSTTSHDIV